MIYKKDANFPYPLLTNTSTSYPSSEFLFDVDLQENTQNYCIVIDYEISSEFILKLLQQKKAQLVLVVQSKDNKFYYLDQHQNMVEIPKSRISLSKRTNLQLQLLAKEDISFEDNEELNLFYDAVKSEIIVLKNSILGFSNPVTFDGSQAKPLELFEKKLDPQLKSEIKIELGSETIIIHYKNENFQFIDSPKSSVLNNVYVYMGLQRALTQFIMNHSQDGEEIDLDEIDVPENGLDLKLYNLMRKKMIQRVSLDTMDEVIALISDRILEKFTTAVRGMYVGS
ncbi:MAG: hypothetical protein Q4Q00_11615 [Turicibacter sp.]|nr:hypothetical protein [Turicibacter sp.]